MSCRDRQVYSHDETTKKRHMSDEQRLAYHQDKSGPLMEKLREWLAEHVPGRERRVLKRMREFRGGELYDSEFGTRMRGSGRHAELLATRFDLACRQNGLNVSANSVEPERLDDRQFRAPKKPPPENEQLQLFSD